MSQEIHGRYLEPKPYKKTRFFGIKGHNMTVWHLVATMRANQFAIQETAEGFDLPVEAVEEALDYYMKNKAEIVKTKKSVADSV